MRIDEVKYSLSSLAHKKTRSILTTLSILIGIMAVFALISFGLGIKAYTNTLADQAGRDKLFIMPKGFSPTGDFSISQSDIDYVSHISGVKEISGIYTKAAEVKYKDQTRYTNMLGYDTTKSRFVFETNTLKIDKGREIRTGETGKVILGYNYEIANKVFAKPLTTGTRITINNQPFEVVGFFQELGNPSDDMNIYISYEGMQTLYPDVKDRYAMAIIRAEQDVKPSDLAEKIQEKLRKHDGLAKGSETFYVQTFEDLLATFAVILDVINGVLVLIALISVIVASVNIMNTMYTAVMERTKEIGVMKAIGARNSDIYNIFVLESAVLGFIGGAIGIVLGFIVASIGGAIAAGAGLGLLRPLFPWYLIAGCLLFATAVGAGSGILPAKQAAQQKPVDSLRYE